MIKANIALVGVPNCGKTSLFNALTGGRAKVANYAGVTVDRKIGEAVTASGHHFNIIDLPGTYSLRARSLDEEITRDVVMGKRPDTVIPDLIIAVADATNMRTALRLVMELKQTGRPLLLVVNMMDIARHRGMEIDLEKIQKSLGIDVVESTAVRKAGMEILWAKLDQILSGKLPHATQNQWSDPSVSTLRIAQRTADALVKEAIKLPPVPNTTSHKIDKVLLHPIFGLVALFAILFIMFQAVFAWAGPLMDGIEALFGWLGGLVTSLTPEGLFQSFLLDALIGGVGGVLVFLPQILIVFLFILLLEDLGYMSRAAFLMDKIMGGAGLHGRAFIPLLSSFACAIPGIMSARVIESPRDRLATIMVAPLMTCSARIPVYTLIISAFIPSQTVAGFSLQGLVMFGLYAFGIIFALLVSFMIKLWSGSKHVSPPFMMELPDYKIPTLKGVAIGMQTRAMIFLKRAGTTIFYMAILLWVLTTFPFPPEGATEPAINYSFAAQIGSFLEPIFRPIGFDWAIVVSLIPAMAAREVVVASLGTIYAVGGDAELGALIGQQWSLATALSVLAWFVFAPQCLATLAVIARETGARKWAWIALVYMFALAYLASFVTYQIAIRFA